MNKRIALVATLLAGIVGVGAIAPVMAESHTAADAAEIQAMATVKLTLAQASAAAAGAVMVLRKAWKTSVLQWATIRLTS